MSNRNISDDNWKVYLRCINKGLSKRAAAREAGVSWATVMRAEKDPHSRLTRLMPDFGFDGAGVIGYDRLSPAAAKGLKDFQYFRKRYLGRSESPWQEEAAYKIVEKYESPEKEYVVVNAPPGSGKSTFFTHDLPCWMAVRNRAIRCMIGSRTEKQAKMYTGRLRRTFERQIPVKADPELKEKGLAEDAVATLVADYGRFKPANPELWRIEEFVIAQQGGVAVEDKESSFVAYGMDSGFLGGRYDLVIWDDLVDKRTMRTQEARENLVNWWETEAETRLEPGGLFILQGQRMGPDDLYRYALNLLDVSEEDVVDLATAPRKYHHIVYKSHYEDKCEGNHGRDAKSFPDGCLLDPIRLSWRELSRIKSNKNDRFRILYQQEDVDPQAQLVQKLWIDGGVGADGVEYPGCWDDDRPSGVIPKNISTDAYSVITADPSPTKNWSVQWWLYDTETEMQTLLDMYRGPMDASDFLDWNHAEGTFSGLLEEWWWRSDDVNKPFTYLIVEANAAQRFLLQYDHVKRWQSQRGVNIVPHSTHRNKSDPDFGVQTLAPHYRFGRVRLPGLLRDGSKNNSMKLVNELLRWPEGVTDDCVMAHWFLVWNAQKIFPQVILNPPRFDRPTWMLGAHRYIA